jgi:leader peptidase (prepilin peptidase)/N-methyltransferase
MAAIVAVVIGLFVAGIVWNLARRQAARIPLFGGEQPISIAELLPISARGTRPFEKITGNRRDILQRLFEVTVAAYFGALGWKFGFSLDLVMAMVFSLPLLLIALVDFWTRLIHTRVIYIGIALGIAFAATDGLDSIVDSLLGMALATGIFILFFALAILIYRNINVVPFGLGDVYLAAMIGAMVGVNLVLRALVLGIFLAGVILGALLVARVLSRKQAVAYGPYLCLGALLTMLFS